MRSVVASLACLLFLVGCQTESQRQPRSRHEGSSSHDSADGSVEPVQDGEASRDAGSADASLDIELDASMTHVSEPGTPRRPSDPPADPKPDAGPTNQADAAVHNPPEATVDSGTSGAGSDADVPDLDAALDSGSDLDAAVDTGSDAETATDAGSDADADPEDAAIDAGADAGSDAGLDASTPTCSGPPGMYKDDYCQVLADGIRAYRPQYPLWSDGATKERYILLPAGKRIDTRNPDRWTFPKGTKFFKMFSWDGVRVETRVLEKTGTDDTADFTAWTATSYAWSADQNSVSPASTNGVTNALGTPLDIPSQAQCRQCHNMTGADAAIGFNAIQLNHGLDGVTLSSLLDENLLVNGSSSTLNVSLGNAVIPGDAKAKAALGYLHGNCGHCHGGPSPRAGQALWSKVGITDLSNAPIFQTAVCHCLEGWTGRTNSDGDPYELRVAPAHEALSGIIGRMSQRGPREQMPPVGTELTDPTGLATVRAWIDSLDGTECDASPPICQ